MTIPRPLSRSRQGRTALLTGLRSTPWRAGEKETRALQGGFAESSGFWALLLWAVIADVPHGLRPVDVPVVLAQGTVDVIGSGQTPRYLFLLPGSSFVPLWGAGHAPQSDRPEAIVALVHRAAAAASAKTRP